MRVVVTPPGVLDSAWQLVTRLLGQVDLACSRFRADSELSQLNSQPGRPVQVSPMLAAALDWALWGARISNGALDPTIGLAITAAGYNRDFQDLKGDCGKGIDPAPVPAGGWRSIRLDRRRGLVELPAGVEIDLGATAKSLAADLAARTIVAALGGGALVSLGGDISMIGDHPGGGWRIQVAEDSRERSFGAAIIRLEGGGVATSSTTVRRWSRAGTELHHIIDPLTGIPSQGPFRTASTLAGSCVEANIASTVALVMGRNAPAWLEGRRIPARLVDQSGQITCLGGWPQDVSAALR